MAKKKPLEECRTQKDFDRHARRHPDFEGKANGKGSHIKYYGPRGVAVTYHNGNKPYPKGTRRSIIRQFKAIGLLVLILGCMLSQLVATSVAAALEADPSMFPTPAVTETVPSDAR